MHDSPALAAAVLAEAASIAASAQAVVAAELRLVTGNDARTADRAAIRATTLAGEAAAVALAAARAATAETAAGLAALAAVAAAAVTGSVEDAAVTALGVANAAAAIAAAADRTAVTVAAAVAARADSAGAGVEPTWATGVAAGATEAGPSTVAAAPVDRLAGLLRGLDESVRREWGECLSWPVAPLSLPGIRVGPGRAATAPGLHGLVRDLTLARRIELAMAASGDTLQATFEHAPLAMLQATFDGYQLLRFLRVNQAMCELTGYSKDQLLALDPGALARVPDAPTVVGRYSAINHPSQDVLHWEHADGHSIDVQLHLRPVLEADGSAGFLIGLVEDVTARQRVQAVLRGSEELFRAAYENAPIATLLIRLTGEPPGALLRANQAACQLTGYTEPELMACDLDMLLGTDRGRQRIGGGNQSLARCRHASGQSFQARLTTRVVPGFDGSGDLLIAQIAGLT